jgi:hypothetical protein
VTGKIVGSGDKTRYLLDMGGVKGFVEVSKEAFDKAIQNTDGIGLPGTSKVKPKKCHPLAVNPRDRKKAEEYAKKRGVPTEFNERGVPIIKSREHQKQLNRIYNVVNYDGGYGD